jgi:hypothetical protein
VRRRPPNLPDPDPNHGTFRLYCTLSPHGCVPLTEADLERMAKAAEAIIRATLGHRLARIVETTPDWYPWPTFSVTFNVK